MMGYTVRRNEAVAIGSALGEVPAAELDPCLNLGASTRHFRTVMQPHVHHEVIGPLEARGVRVLHSDIKEDAAVDIVGDIFDDRTLEALAAVGARSVLCCNMFEHVENRAAMARRIDAVLQPGGFVMVSVPHSYPLHFDPIDTYFRPTPREIAGLFEGYAVIASGIVEDSTYLQDLRRRLGPTGTLRHIAASLLKTVMIWRGRQWWLAHFHRYLWLLRPYKVSWLLARKPAGRGAPN